ncbi:MAG TPA: hypothetical protein VFD32_06935 [Dehalococcoidia bacterium]|nr:hypothetical protein [Dehalococcoidia bacterium]
MQTLGEFVVVACTSACPVASGGRGLVAALVHGIRSGGLPVTGLAATHSLNCNARARSAWCCNVFVVARSRGASR